MSKSVRKTENRSGWWWIPSLYFAEGIPYIIVMFVASDMYKTLGVSNAKFAFWTSLLYLAWVVKPLWSPFVDIYSSKRKWVIVMQMVLAGAFLGVSLALHTPLWFPLSLLFLWIMAFSSATHDIAADGLYMLALNDHDQAFFTGIRSTFYRIAMIAGLGLLVMLTGVILQHTGLEPLRLNIEAVPRSEISEPINPEQIVVEQSSETPQILVFPSDIKVPLYNKNDLYPCDSTNIYFVLSAPPPENESIQMTFGQKKGSKDIYLATSGAFKFTKENWNVPQKATLKVKHNLKNRTSARFEAQAGDVPFAWSMSIGFLGLLFILFAFYHKHMLPKPVEDQDEKKEKEHDSYLEVFASFFRKKEIVASVAFLLLYRFSESQLTKMASPFLLDARENGGLALSLTEKGFAYGTIGLISLLTGGILGGIIASRDGLKKWIWWFAISINIPNAVYIFLSYAMPDNRALIYGCIAIEQLGYGFGFTGYMLYMLYIAGQGKHKTAHYAIATGFMALGMMIPGMISGAMQELLGYQHFFIYVIICTIPSFLALTFIKVDPNFGKRSELKTST